MIYGLDVIAIKDIFQAPAKNLGRNKALKTLRIILNASRGSYESTLLLILSKPGLLNDCYFYISKTPSMDGNSIMLVGLCVVNTFFK